MLRKGNSRERHRNAMVSIVGSSWTGAQPDQQIWVAVGWKEHKDRTNPLDYMRLVQYLCLCSMPKDHFVQGKGGAWEGQGFRNILHVIVFTELTRLDSQQGQLLPCSRLAPTWKPKKLWISLRQKRNVRLDGEVGNSNILWTNEVTFKWSAETAYFHLFGGGELFHLSPCLWETRRIDCQLGKAIFVLWFHINDALVWRRNWAAICEVYT